MIEIENHYWGTTIEVVDQKEVIGGDLGWWEQSIDVACSQYPPQLLRKNGNWALRNISHGETADTYLLSAQHHFYRIPAEKTRPESG